MKDRSSKLMVPWQLVLTGAEVGPVRGKAARQLLPLQLQQVSCWPEVCQGWSRLPAACPCQTAVVLIQPPACRCEYACSSKHIVKNREKSTEKTGDSVLPVILNLSTVFKVVGFLSEQRIYVFMSSFVF